MMANVWPNVGLLLRLLRTRDITLSFVKMVWTSVYHTGGLQMTLAAETAQPLPARRAFVVQFSAQTQVDLGWFAGRVEHVVSGHARRFQTLDELLACDVGRGARGWPAETVKNARAERRSVCPSPIIQLSSRSSA